MYSPLLGMVDPLMRLNPPMQIRAIDKEIYGAVKAQGGAHARAR